MNWGVIPIQYDDGGNHDDDARVHFTVKRVRASWDTCTEGDVVVATAGRSRRSGGTDMIQVLRV